MAKRPASVEVVDERKLFTTDPILQLSKLSWLIVEMYQRRHLGPAPRTYLAIDAASTAWHLHEWLWNNASEDQQKMLSKATGSAANTLDAFRTGVQRWNWAIGACRQLAIAHKHVKVGYNRDDVYFEAMYDDEEEDHPCTVYIHVNGDRHIDVLVFEVALAAWSGLYRDIGMNFSDEVRRALNS